MQDHANASLELYSFGSTNGHKVAIALEELGLDYRLHTVNVFAGESEYTVVDIAFFAWYAAASAAGFAFDAHSNLSAWFERISARPAVARGLTIPAPTQELPPRKRV